MRRLPVKERLQLSHLFSPNSAMKQMRDAIDGFEGKKISVLEALELVTQIHEAWKKADQLTHDLTRADDRKFIIHLGLIQLINLTSEFFGGFYLLLSYLFPSKLLDPKESSKLKNLSESLSSTEALFILLSIIKAVSIGIYQKIFPMVYQLVRLRSSFEINGDLLQTSVKDWIRIREGFFKTASTVMKNVKEDKKLEELYAGFTVLTEVIYVFGIRIKTYENTLFLVDSLEKNKIIVDQYLTEAPLEDQHICLVIAAGPDDDFQTALKRDLGRSYFKANGSPKSLEMMLKKLRVNDERVFEVETHLVECSQTSLNSIFMKISLEIKLAKKQEKIHQISKVIEFIRSFMYLLPELTEKFNALCQDCQLKQAAFERGLMSKADLSMEEVSEEAEKQQQIRDAKKEERDASYRRLYEEQRAKQFAQRSSAKSAVSAAPRPISAETEYQYSDAELFLAKLEDSKNRASAAEKLTALDNFIKENSAELQEKPVDQIFLQLAHAQWTLEAIEAEFNKKGQIKPAGIKRLKAEIAKLEQLRASYSDFDNGLLLAEIRNLKGFFDFLEPPVKKPEPVRPAPVAAAPAPAAEPVQSAPKEPIRVKIPDDVEKIMRALNGSFQGFHTGAAYVVGGYVRDSLLGLKPKDVDLLCLGFGTGIVCNENFRAELAQKLKDQFGDKVLITVKNLEFGGEALRRVLIVEVGGQRYDLLFSEKSSLREEMLERDFDFNTLLINADSVVLEILPGSIQHCLEKRCVPVNPENFFNDPVRILRGLDFSLLRGYSFDAEFSLKFFDSLKELKAKNQAKLLEYLGEARGQFSARLKKLLFSVETAENRKKMIEFLGTEVFSLLTDAARAALDGHGYSIAFRELGLQSNSAWSPVLFGAAALFASAPVGAKTPTHS